MRAHRLFQPIQINTRLVLALVPTGTVLMAVCQSAIRLTTIFTGRPTHDEDILNIVWWFFGDLGEFESKSRLCLKASFGSGGLAYAY